MKFLISAVLLLLSACATFGQTSTADAKPVCGSPQIGSYGTYEVAPSSSLDSGYAGLNPVPVGFILCGTYTKLTVEMTTPVPADDTENVMFGFYDKTNNWLYLITCYAVPGSTSCTALYPASFVSGDDVYFTVYISGLGHTGYAIKNLTWRLE
jgi:hypothetical protein